VACLDHLVGVGFWKRVLGGGGRWVRFLSPPPHFFEEKFRCCFCIAIWGVARQPIWCNFPTGKGVAAWGKLLF
jgi:hypothetical protein